MGGLMWWIARANGSLLSVGRGFREGDIVDVGIPNPKRTKREAACLCRRSMMEYPVKVRLVKEPK